ncbi:MAG: hypothetical protein NT169_18185 [Chloroflexi bacterium]|nr:hypothetical protein [Chloroflexota bacterium]
MSKKLLIPLSLALVLTLVVGGVALAQGVGPKAEKAVQAAKVARAVGAVRPLGGFGADWATFDAVAGALKLTPAQLFEQLHSGMTLQKIATAQGVDMQAVKDAVKAARETKATAAIQKALDNGKITQEQADWMRKGLDNGWRWPPRLLKRR